MSNLPALKTEVGNPDVEAAKFNERSGTWSLYAEDCFEKHLKQLAQGKTTHLWYGYKGLPFKKS